MSIPESRMQARLVVEALAFHAMRAAAALLSGMGTLCRVHQDLALLVALISCRGLGSLLHCLVQLGTPALRKTASFLPRQFGGAGRLAYVAAFHPVEPQKAPTHAGSVVSASKLNFEGPACVDAEPRPGKCPAVASILRESACAFPLRYGS